MDSTNQDFGVDMIRPSKVLGRYNVGPQQIGLQQTYGVKNGLTTRLAARLTWPIFVLIHPNHTGLGLVVLDEEKYVKIPRLDDFFGYPCSYPKMNSHKMWASRGTQPEGAVTNPGPKAIPP